MLLNSLMEGENVKIMRRKLGNDYFDSTQNVA